MLMFAKNGPMSPIISPSSVSGLFAWYDLTSSTYVTLSGNEITNALDRSGNGYDTAITALTPTLTSNSLNNVSAAVCGGADALVLPTAVKNVLDDTNYTLFCVAKATSNTTSQCPIGGYAVSNAFGFFYNSGGIQNKVSFSVFQGSAAKTGIAVNVPNILLGYKSGTSCTLYVNGGAGTTSTIPSTVTITAGGMGSDGFANFLSGALGEVILYNAALSITDRTNVLNYLSNKFSIPVTGLS